MEITFKNGSKIISVETAEKTIRGDIRGYIEIPDYRIKKYNKLMQLIKNILMKVKTI